MTIADRERLLRRIRQIRRSDAAAGRPTADVKTSGDTDTGQADRVEDLEARVAHLEQLLQGLQDSVHRESERHSALIADLQSRVEPGAMGAAIAEDARHRGL